MCDNVYRVGECVGNRVAFAKKVEDNAKDYMINDSRAPTVQLLTNTNKQVNLL